MASVTVGRSGAKPRVLVYTSADTCAFEQRVSDPMSRLHEAHASSCRAQSAGADSTLRSEVPALRRAGSRRDTPHGVRGVLSLRKLLRSLGSGQTDLGIPERVSHGTAGGQLPRSARMMPDAPGIWYGRPLRLPLGFSPDQAEWQSCDLGRLRGLEPSGWLGIAHGDRRARLAAGNCRRVGSQDARPS
jgi:hypothetical protein